MNFDFSKNEGALFIPPDVYKPVKRCPVCQSVFISDKKCESCDLSFDFHPIGIPYGPQSYFGIIERYIESRHVVFQWFPFLEDKTSESAKSLQRKISKRLFDILDGLNKNNFIEVEDRKHFYIEAQIIIEQLLIYGTKKSLVLSYLIDYHIENNENSFFINQLIKFTTDLDEKKLFDLSVNQKILEYRILGVVRLEFFAKVIFYSALAISSSLLVRMFFSLPSGK